MREAREAREAPPRHRKRRVGRPPRRARRQARSHPAHPAPTTFPAQERPSTARGQPKCAASTSRRPTAIVVRWAAPALDPLDALACTPRSRARRAAIARAKRNAARRSGKRRWKQVALMRAPPDKRSCAGRIATARQAARARRRATRRTERVPETVGYPKIDPQSSHLGATARGPSTRPTRPETRTIERPP